MYFSKVYFQKCIFFESVFLKSGGFPHMRGFGVRGLGRAKQTMSNQNLQIKGGLGIVHASLHMNQLQFKPAACSLCFNLWGRVEWCT